MKKILLLATASLLFGTTSLMAEWINPPRKACIKNGGKFYQGVREACEANWYDAKSICSVAEARLPTIDELRRVVTDCGGTINNVENNLNNPAYQSCYQNHGFSSNHYWSSSPAVSDASNAWGVDFGSGYGNLYPKSGTCLVRCVRDSE